MIVRLFLPLLGLMFLLLGCVSSKATQSVADEFCPGLNRWSDSTNDDGCRPFRAGFIAMAPKLDAQKPLGSIDEAGWAVVDGVLVGAVDRQWATGFDLKAQRHLWWLKLDSSLAAPVTAFGDDVILGLRNGELLRVQAKTGQLKWMQKLGRFIARPMALAKSTLVVINVDQKVFALDFATGNRKWVFDAGKPASLNLQGETGALIRGSEVFVGIADGRILSIDFDNGRLNWQFNPGFSEFRFKNIIEQMALIDNRLVFARYDGLLAALNVGSGQRRLLWQQNLPSLTQMTVRDGMIYLGSLNGELYSVDSRSGKKVWSASFGETVTALAGGERLLYAAGSNGRIAALRNSDGQILWHDDLGSSINHAPLLVGEFIYFPTGMKNLYGYRLF